METRIDSSSPPGNVALLLAEYHELYGLLQFRMNALDRRTPVLTGLPAALLGALTAMAPEVARALLIGVPVGLYALALTTMNHARSQEDLLRRIEELEQAVNAAMGCELLGFQSSHPSRVTTVGGRTGVLTASLVSLLCIATLIACLYTFARYESERPALVLYACYCVVVGTAILVAGRQLRRYRYRKQPPPRPAGDDPTAPC